MNRQFKNYAVAEKTATKNAYMIKRNGVRISVLTPYLIRVEEQVSSVFCDQATQVVICRNFDTPDFTEKRESGRVTIHTKAITFVYSFRKHKVESITTESGSVVTDYGTGNLKGTRRTLDQTNGKASLEDGVLSRNGVAVLDDSSSLLFTADGSVLPRKVIGTDRYYFAYGHRYVEAIRDFFNLTGFPPLIPRFALGNWWSRYKAYTAQEYQDLMQRFIDEKIPITVATIDMDWHWVNVVDKFGKAVRNHQGKRTPRELFFDVISPGWTGYSWNTDLFPDPDKFLAWLKNRNLKVTMNLHPAAGCRFFEDAYRDFAEYMGIDPESQSPIPFDITDEKFIHGYFEYLHHPLEAAVVDF